jgi:hypothetical protein
MTRPRFAGIAFTLVCLAAVSACRSHYSMPVEPGTRLTEPVALKASRQAIESAGYDARRGDPVCYWHTCDRTSPYLAKNDANPGSGYTLWRLTDRADGAVWHLFVRLELRADSIDCAVSEAH